MTLSGARGDGHITEAITHIPTMLIRVSSNAGSGGTLRVPRITDDVRLHCDQPYPESVTVTT